ncbi:ASH1L methyltransferase, partial [Leiothrix lutea]|nr:ASH1L methyltransferase [Leiothrix lutea]
DPSKSYKKAGEVASVELRPEEGIQVETTPLSKKVSPLHSEMTDYIKSPPPTLISSHNSDLKDRTEINGATTVTEKLAQLIATCPPSKSSKAKQKKPGSGSGATSGLGKDSGKKLPGAITGSGLVNKDLRPPGISTPTAGLVHKDSGKKQPVASSAVGLISKDVGRKLAGMSAPTALTNKEPLKKPVGISTPAGLVNKDAVGKKLLGVSSPTGLLNKDSGRKMPGTGNSTVLVNKDSGRKTPGIGSPMGPVSKEPGRKMPGISSPVGLVSKDCGKKPAGIGTPAGLANKDSGTLKADSLVPSSEPFKLPCNSNLSSLESHEPADLLKENTTSKTFEKHIMRQSKESILDKFSIRKEIADVGKEMFNEGMCVPQDAYSSSEKGIYETSKHEKQPPVYCTSPDFRTGGASEVSTAKSPFSAVGEGNLPSPSPTVSVPTLNRSLSTASSQLASNSLHLSSTAELLEGISDPVGKTPFSSDSSLLSLNRTLSHTLGTDFKGAEKDLSDSKASYVETSRTSPPAGKKPVLAAETSIHATVTPSVVSFTSLFGSKQFLKIGAIAASEKSCQGAKNLSSTQQSKPLKKRKGRKPRWTKVVSRSACRPPKGLELERSELFKNISYSALSGSNLEQAKFLKNIGSSSFVEHEFVKHQLPKLNEASGQSLALLAETDKQTQKFYSAHKQPSSLCMSDDFLPDIYKPKRGRPKSKEMPELEGPPKRTLKIPASKVFSVQSKEEQEPPILQPEVEIPSLKQSLSGQAFPKKRGRPKRQIRSSIKMKPPILSVAPFVGTENSSKMGPESEQHRPGEFFERKDQLRGPEEVQSPSICSMSDLEVDSDRKVAKRNNGQLMKTIIRKINKMKTLKRKKLLNQILSSTVEPNTKGKMQSKLHNTVSTLAATFGSKLGQQINVSKKGTIYIGKRRGRKPKAVLNGILASSAASLTVLEKSAQQAPGTSLGQVLPHLLPSAANPSEILPSPVCSQSSAVSGGQSPVSSDAGFIEPSSVPYLHLHSRQGGVVQTLAMKKAAKGRRRLSPPTLLPNSPSHLSELTSLKEATPSPVSESHSDETIPSDSGIGTDNNSTSDRAEKFCGQKKKRHSFDHVSALIPPETSTVLSNLKEKHKHKCKRRGHDYLSYDKMKRQKRKRKKKYPQLRGRQDPDFLAELEELISRLSEIRITHRSHHFIPRDLLPTIFRINFNSFYTHPTFPLDPLHYIRKPDLKKKRGRPPKMREAMAEMPFMHSLSFPLSSTGFYPSYGMPYSPSPLAAAPIGLGYYGRYPPTLYPPPPSPSFTTPLPPPSYMHTGHLLLNPTKYHKKKHKLLRQEAFLTTSRTPLLSMSTYPSVPPEMAYGWMLEHKHRHRHKHREHRSSEQPQVSMDTITANSSSRTVLESLKRYRFGKEAVGERYKHKEKHRCHMACPHLSPSKGLLSRDEQWVRREPSESNSLALGLQTPLQIDCSENSPALSLGGFTPSSEAAGGDEHTNLFTSAIGSCRVAGSGSANGRKKLPESPGLFGGQDAALGRPLRKEPVPSLEKALQPLAGPLPSQDKPSQRQLESTNCSPSRKRSTSESTSSPGKSCSQGVWVWDLPVVVLSVGLECLWLSVCLSERSCSCLGSEPAVPQPLGSVSKEQQQQFQGTHGCCLRVTEQVGSVRLHPQKARREQRVIYLYYFVLKCRAGSVNPSSCLRVVAVSMSAPSKRLLFRDSCWRREQREGVRLCSSSMAIPENVHLALEGPKRIAELEKCGKHKRGNPKASFPPQSPDLGTALIPAGGGREGGHPEIQKTWTFFLLTRFRRGIMKHCETFLMGKCFFISAFSSSFSETVAEPPSPHEALGKPPESETPEQPLPPLTQREKKAPRPPKKKYQKAGLYSDVYKTTE